jgi:thiol-disulfide isomerase/thioredoxin
MKRFVICLIAAMLTMNMTAQSGRKKVVRKITSRAKVDRKVGFTIAGTVEGTKEGDKVFIAEMQGYFSFLPTDSTVVRNGRYLIRGQQRQPALRFVIAMHDTTTLAITDIILEDTDIVVNLHRDENKNEVKGGRDNTLWKEYNTWSNAENAKIEPTYRSAQDSTLSAEVRREAQEKVTQWEKEQLSAQADYILSHIPSGVSSILLSEYYSHFDEATLKKILNNMQRSCPQDEVYREIVREREVTRRTAIGSQYTDITLESPEGRAVKVSDIVTKNKVTMIDFWASWCGPCRAEMPNVVKVYNEYKDKGFAIVGVSLDNSKEAWTKAIASLGITWPQMSDLKGWSSAGAAAYNIRAIPATVLIGQDGHIIARDLRGEDLEKTVANYLSTHH